MSRTANEKKEWVKLWDFLDYLKCLTPREEEYAKFRLGMDKEFSAEELEMAVRTLVEQKVISIRTREQAVEKFGFKTEKRAIQLERKIVRCMLWRLDLGRRSKKLRDYLK